jgi:hypothetical protein
MPRPVFSSQEELVEGLKSIGYKQKEIRLTAHKIMTVYLDEKWDRVSALHEIADTFGGRYEKTGTTWRNAAGAAVFSNGWVVVAKPSAIGARTNIAFTALDFSGLGKKSKFTFQDKNVPTVTFSNAEEIERSIMQGVKKNLKDTYVEAFDMLFNSDSGELEWAPGTDDRVKNKLGTYVGELLVGWTIFKNQERYNFVNNPFSGERVTSLAIPTDTRFPGVDSIIESKDGFFPISSKYGEGAAASFFTNVFPDAIRKRSSLSRSVLKQMADFAATNNIKGDQSSKFVWSYGLKHLLKVRYTGDATAIMRDIASKKKTDKIAEVSAAILKHSQTNRYIEPHTMKQIRKQLPMSASSYFNRTISAMLDNDRASKREMMEILRGKSYLQANLNVAEWRKGNVKYRFTQFGEGSLNIRGDKSPIHNVTSNEGWINYILR